MTEGVNMSISRRKIRPYHPRKKSHSQELVRQQLTDLEHKISADVSALLVLFSEGSSQQIAHALQNTKNELIKFTPEMQKLAYNLGGNFPKAVHDFLDSIDSIAHSAAGWIDEAKITRCYNATQKLQNELKAA
jgi:hypothetical protein